MRAINRSKKLETIRTVGTISWIDIARAIGLSQALVTGLTTDLIEEVLIIIVEKDILPVFTSKKSMIRHTLIFNSSCTVCRAKV